MCNLPRRASGDKRPTELSNTRRVSNVGPESASPKCVASSIHRRSSNTPWLCAMVSRAGVAMRATPRSPNDDGPVAPKRILPQGITPPREYNTSDPSTHTTEPDMSLVQGGYATRRGAQVDVTPTAGLTAESCFRIFSNFRSKSEDFSDGDAAGAPGGFAGDATETAPFFGVAAGADEDELPPRGGGCEGFFGVAPSSLQIAPPIVVIVVVDAVGARRATQDRQILDEAVELIDTLE